MVHGVEHEICEHVVDAGVASLTPPFHRTIDDFGEPRAGDVLSLKELFGHLIGELNESLGDNSTQMKDSFAKMHFTADRVFMSLAKLDHVLWKVNTYYSAATKEEQFKFVDHHSCRLGKWYYEGDGKDNFSKTSSYSKLEKPHAVVHNGTNKVFSLMLCYRYLQSYYYRICNYYRKS